MSCLEDGWPLLVVQTCCPHCRKVGRFARHAVYRKYHFRRQVEILRVRCKVCRVTHALIPSFSLPGTSIGTEEAEAYLIGRGRGLSRAKAGEALSRQGMSDGYPKRLEGMFAAAVHSGKALLAGKGESELGGLEWVASVCGAIERPLYGINRFGLEQQVNGLCSCRRWLLKYRRIAVGGRFSRNSYSPAGGRAAVDSG